jgi:hypothetical protein
MDFCALNTRRIETGLRDEYAESGSQPVSYDLEEIARMGTVPARADLLAEDGIYARHDPAKLAALILSLACESEQFRSVGAPIALVA